MMCIIHMYVPNVSIFSTREERSASFKTMSLCSLRHRPKAQLICTFRTISIYIIAQKVSRQFKTVLQFTTNCNENTRLMRDRRWTCSYVILAFGSLDIEFEANTNISLWANKPWIFHQENIQPNYLKFHQSPDKFPSFSMHCEVAL